MKILWLGHFAPWPPHGGAPQRSYHLLRQIASGAEVHFAGLSLPGHQRNAEERRGAVDALSRFCASVEVWSAGFRGFLPGKAAILATSLARGRAYGESWLDSPHNRGRARRALARVEPDLVHVDSVMVAGLLPSAWIEPAVLNHHNAESHMMARRAEGARGVLKPIFRVESRRLETLERRMAPRFSRHLVVSALDGSRLRSVAPEARVAVVPNGVDVEYFQPSGIAPEPRTIVFAGRMNWYPNEHAMVRFLQDLWPAVKRAAPGVRLIIAGMNPTRALVRAAGQDPDVVITGFVEDMRAVLASASVYVCPILDGGGTRLKVLDAMAMAMPIVATPLAVEGIDVQDGADVVVREFGPEFVDAISRTLADEGRRAELGRNARELAVSTYSWPRIGEELLRIYRDVLETEGRKTRRGG